MSKEYDVIIIGAGHNGLVTAGYLARAGLRTLVLESRPVVGGACVMGAPGHNAAREILKDWKKLKRG
jgi:flavin-dependent dehydrogenase